jgi:hypothetical protein
VIKAGYDFTLWAWFRRVPLPESDARSQPQRVQESS